MTLVSDIFLHGHLKLLAHLWMRPAKVVGSSRLKPDVRRDVSYNSQMRSFTVLSLWSADACREKK